MNWLIVAIVVYQVFVWSMIVWTMRDAAKARRSAATLRQRVDLIERALIGAGEDMALIKRLSVEMGEHFQAHQAQLLARTPSPVDTEV